MAIPLEMWHEKFAQLHGPGELMHGSDMSNEQAIIWAREHFPDGKYCIVRDWVWHPFSVSDAVAKELQRNQCQPIILRAERVIFDSVGRFGPGDWVQSSGLIAFSEEFIFQTRNTAYVLLGLGYRKAAGNN